MPDCPHCFHELEENRSDGGVSWQCPDCGGLLATLPFLRRRLSVEAANSIWQTAREMEPGSSSRECPFCGKGMVRVRSEFEGHDIELDACLPCQAFWFDRGEIDALPEAPPPPPPEPEPELSDEAREKLATVKMEMIRAQADCGSPSHDGETAGLPSPNTFPWATLLILVLFILEWMATPPVRVSHESRSRLASEFWFFLIVMVWQFWPLGRVAEAELGGRLMTLWAVSTFAAGVVHFAAGCDTTFLFLPLALESLLGILVWLAMRFPWGRVASNWKPRLQFGPPVLVWLPLSLVSTIWGILCVYIPSTLLKGEASGVVAATLAAAAVGVVFHVILRRHASRHRMRAQ